MAIPKRLRFEILRRDNYACHYCGAKASEGATLQVDHVIPEALGGPTEPENLVTACSDCNAGKSSINPTEATVAEVQEAAAEWRAAMELAAEELDGRTAERMAAVRKVDELWLTWTNDETPMPRPRDWARSIETFITSGLTVAKLEELVLVAMNSKVKNVDVWRYFCGCCWGAIRQLQDRAAEILADAPEPGGHSAQYLEELGYLPADEQEMET